MKNNFPHSVDILIVTNLPAFYKINLYNNLSAYKRILVIYTGYTSNQRNEDFFSAHSCYKYVYLQGNFFGKLFNVIRILSTIQYCELIVGGWDQIICWLFAFCSPVRKNGCVVESSIFESKTVGIKAIAKRLYLKRFSKAYVCGLPHSQLVEQLGFNGNIIKTGGCGILNYVSQPPFCARTTIRNFLYVGRLVPEKNIQLLIEVFNGYPTLNLMIIGFGPLESALKSIANSNITFVGAIENKKLSRFYQESDVFVLPSKSEPWGLVVEEALNNGTPVLVSDKVGCYIDLVLKKDVGVIFKSEDVNSLKKGIDKMLNVDYYNSLRLNISRLDFNSRVRNQLNCYL